MEDIQELGFVPRQVIKDLQDIGNWKSRAAAIDALQNAVQQVPDRSPVLLVGLRQLVGFLVTLTADPNFKVSISSMQILGEVAAKAGQDILPHISCITAAVAAKFDDSKVIVRNACSRLLLRLMLVVKPMVVITSLEECGLRHPSARVRQESVHCLGQVLVAFTSNQLDIGLLGCMLLAAVEDENVPVQQAGLEVGALLRKQLGNEKFEAVLSSLPASQDALSKLTTKSDRMPETLSKPNSGLDEALSAGSAPLARTHLMGLINTKLDDLDYTGLRSSKSPPGEVLWSGVKVGDPPTASNLTNNPFLSAAKKVAPRPVNSLEDASALLSMQLNSKPGAAQPAGTPRHLPSTTELVANALQGTSTFHMDLARRPDGNLGSQSILSQTAPAKLIRVGNTLGQESSTTLLAVAQDCPAEAYDAQDSTSDMPCQPNGARTYSGIAQQRAKLRRASTGSTFSFLGEDISTSSLPAASAGDQYARAQPVTGAGYTCRSEAQHALGSGAPQSPGRAQGLGDFGQANAKATSAVQHLLSNLGRPATQDSSLLANDIVASLRAKLNIISAQTSLLPPPTWIQHKSSLNTQSSWLNPSATTNSSNTSSPGLLSPSWSPNSSLEQLKPPLPPANPPNDPTSHQQLRPLVPHSKLMGLQTNHHHDAPPANSWQVHSSLELRDGKDEVNNSLLSTFPAARSARTSTSPPEGPWGKSLPTDSSLLQVASSNAGLEQGRARLESLEQERSAVADLFDSHIATPRQTLSRPTSGRRAVASPLATLCDGPPYDDTVSGTNANLTTSLSSKTAWIPANSSSPTSTMCMALTPSTGSPMSSAKLAGSISQQPSGSNLDWGQQHGSPNDEWDGVHDASNNSCNPEITRCDRRETWSPSKELRLANLKKRQQQKRAVSANSGTPQGSLDGTSSCSSFPSFDSGSTTFDSTAAKLNQSPSPQSASLAYYDSNTYTNHSPSKPDPEHWDRPWNLSGLSSGVEESLIPKPSGAAAQHHTSRMQQLERLLDRPGMKPHATGSSHETSTFHTGHPELGTPRRTSSISEPDSAPPAFNMRRRSSSTAEGSTSSRDTYYSASDHHPDPVASSPTMIKTNRVLGRTRSKGNLSDGPSTPPTPGSSRSLGATFAAGKAVVEELSAADLMPVPEPDAAVRRVISKLKSCNAADRKELDWQGQYEAFNDARRLLKHHPEVIKPILHEFVVVAAPGIEQLRSYTARNALMLFQEMFINLGRGLDKELDEIVPLLVKKASEISNAGRENWLASEADLALTYMTQNCSETRTVTALLACAAHKSMHGRTRVGSHLDEVVELPGARTALVNNWTLLERLFRQAAAFLEEGSLDTRTYGKRIIWGVKTCVGNRTDFERLILSVQPESLKRKVQDVVEGSNGPPPPPRCIGVSRNPARQAGSAGSNSSLPSASSRGTSPSSILSAPSSAGSALDGPRSRFAKASNAADNSVLNFTPNGMAGPSPNTHGQARSNKMTPSINPEIAFQVEKILGNVSSKDWRARSDALKDVLSLGNNIAQLPDNLGLGLLDALIARLSDGNSKVNIQALEALSLLVQQLHERCLPSINILIPALVSNIGSSNDKVKGAAVATLDVLIDSVEPSMLLQNLSHCVANGNVRGRPLLAEKLCGVTEAVYPTKPSLVVKYAVPAALSLLHDVKNDARAVCQALVSKLYQLLGDELFDHASGASHTKLQELLASMGR